MGPRGRVSAGWTEGAVAVADRPSQNQHRDNLWLALVAAVVGGLAGPAPGQTRSAPAVCCRMSYPMVGSDRYGCGPAVTTLTISGQGQPAAFPVVTEQMSGPCI